MKRLLLVLVSVSFMSVSAFAVSEVWTSSHTATVDSNKNLCGNAKATLHSVCVGRSDGGTITLSDTRGTFTSTSTIAVLISTATNVSGCVEFDVKVSSGLTYSTTGAQDTTFMYQCGY